MHRQTVVTFGLFMLGCAQLQAQVFSLDDNPNSPLTAPVNPFFYSAEDPFGTVGPFVEIGPSPTLLAASGAVFLDSDLLTIDWISGSPILDCQVIWADAIDALSTDRDRVMYSTGEIYLRFSVDRLTGGVTGSNLDAQDFLNQQPGDVFRSTQPFSPPISFRGSLTLTPCSSMPTFAGSVQSPSNASNGGEIDESVFRLVAGTGVGNRRPGSFLCPVIGTGTHDNVDALSMYPRRLDADGNGVPDQFAYYSVPPAYALTAGVNPADILADGFAGGNLVFASAAQCGLQAYTPNNEGDDIDALVVWSHVPMGVIDFVDLFAEPGYDYALFSLSPGSKTLTDLRTLCGVPVDGATVFFTDFTGKFAIYCLAPHLGISLGLAGETEHANIDALEILPFKELNTGGGGCGNGWLAWAACADVNHDGFLTPADFTAWINAYNTGVCETDQNGDGLHTPADFTAWLANYQSAASCP